MITFGYIRVSGRGQVAGDGPERQQQAIQDFCRALHLVAPLMFTDNAVSGTVDAMDRPQFAAILTTIEAIRTGHPGEEFCIVVERLDRLARDLIVSELVLAECAKLKIPVYAADRGTMEDQASTGADPTRKLIRQIMGAVSEWEKSVIVKKLRAARDRKRARGERCEGQRPYGDLPGEDHICDQMRVWRVDGESYGSIAIKANSIGWRTRHGKPWTKHSVYQVIERRGVKRP
jgi:DNA invertase Pin-like site-specific DNA recombinase